MSLVSANNLAKSFGAQDIFAQVSFTIPRQAKIALVGPNGSGKTTLLRLIAGWDSPTDGAVHQARGIHIAYLPQQADRFLDEGNSLVQAMRAVFAGLLVQAAELKSLETGMAEAPPSEEALRRYGQTLEAFERSGGYTFAHRIERILVGLGFEQEDFERPIGELSGGQKTRALLARLLLEEPDVLLLDEPTNHLDLAGTEWLEEYLASWQGAMMVVAHDRAFLDSCVEDVWELDWGHLEKYHGNYTAYIAQKTERVARQEALYERQQAEIDRTEDFIRRNIAGQRSREAKGRQKRLERIERIERPRAHRPLGLALYDVDRSGDLAIGLYGLSVGYERADGGQDLLLTVDELELHRGDLVALLGPNGSGKTSLVRTIMGEVHPLAGRVRIGANVDIGYFAQGHTNLDLGRSALDTIMDASALGIGQARNLLGRYHFFGDDIFKRVGDLSGGEQARIALAVLILQGANVLILDEPTNHLDIPSQEVLEESLAGFDGTVLMVTHDRYLIRELAGAVWAIENGQLHAFEAFEDYRRWRERDTQELVPLGKQVEAGGGPASPRMLAREARKAAKRQEEQRARRQSELEERIHKLEARQVELEGQLTAASLEGPADQAAARVSELGLEYARIEDELEELFTAWSEVV
jgi:ATP-binding cassette subfamily F protein 3